MCPQMGTVPFILLQAQGSGLSFCLGEDMGTKKSMAIQVGEYLIFLGIIVIISSIFGALPYYTSVFNDNYIIGQYITGVKSLCGLFLVISGTFIIKVQKNWARLLSIYICLGLGIFSVYCSVKQHGISNFVDGFYFLPVIFYSLPVILLMLPKVKEQFK